MLKIDGREVTDDCERAESFNPRRAGAPKLPWSPAGGGLLDVPPRLAQLLGVVARN